MKIVALLFVLLLPTASPVRSQSPSEDEPAIYYDIYLKDSCLNVWVDLYPLLSARVWDRLRDGVDLAIECRVELNSPRWLWSDRLETERIRTVRLSYRRVTDNFLLATGDSGVDRAFESAQSVGQYLSDSIEVCLAQTARIDPDRTLRVNLRITSIFLTDLNLADNIASGDHSDSPVKFLFRQFLELTDYGRRQYSVRSRPFLLGELHRLQ